MKYHSLIFLHFAVVLGLLIGLWGCACDVDEFFYPIDVQYNLSSNSVPIDTPFEITITVPDNLVTTEGETIDVSDLDFEFRLTAYKYSSNTEPDSIFREDHNEAISVESSEWADRDILLAGLEDGDLGREITFTITPLEKDTLILEVGTGFVTAPGIGSCRPAHIIGLTNTSLPLEDSELILPNNDSIILARQQFSAVLALEII